MEEFAVDTSWEKTLRSDEKDTAVPRFHYETIEDKEATKKAGKPVYRQIELVEVYQPGDRLNIPVLPVTDVERGRWPRHYDAFKKELEMPECEGTPLEMWSFANPAIVKTLNYVECHSVDQLAMIPDTVLQDMGPGMVQLRKRARDHVELRDGDATMVSLKERVGELEEKMAVVLDKNNELQEENEMLAKNQKKRPGRPARVTTEG